MLSRIILSLALVFNFKLYEIRQTRVSSWSPVTIQSFDPVTKEGFEFSLPDDLEIETIGGKGNWLVGKIKKAKDNDWMVGSLEDALGVIIEKKTNSLVWAVRTFGIKWEKKSIENFLANQVSADGETLKKINMSWEEAAKNWFASKKLVDQKSVLRIENSVNFPKLGGHAAKILENAGIKVGLIVTSEQNLIKCEVEGNGLVAEYVAKKFDCVLKEGNELLLRLGREYLDHWKGK